MWVLCRINLFKRSTVDILTLLSTREHCFYECVPICLYLMMYNDIHAYMHHHFYPTEINNLVASLSRKQADLCSVLAVLLQ